MHKGKKKTTIVTTHRNKAKLKKKFAKTIAKKVHKTHKGYPMKKITSGTMTYKRKGRKR